MLYTSGAATGPAGWHVLVESLIIEFRTFTLRHDQHSDGHREFTRPPK